MMISHFRLLEHFLFAIEFADIFCLSIIYHIHQQPLKDHPTFHHSLPQIR